LLLIVGERTSLALSRVAKKKGVWQARLELRRPGHYRLTCTAGIRDDGSGSGVLLSAALRCAPGRVAAAHCSRVYSLSSDDAGDDDDDADNDNGDDNAESIKAGQLAQLQLTLVDSCDNTARLETTRRLTAALHRRADEASDVAHAIDALLHDTLPDASLPLRFFPTRPGSYDLRLSLDDAHFVTIYSAVRVRGGVIPPVTLDDVSGIVFLFVVFDCCYSRVRSPLLF
jgi:hypothetical protein